MRNMSFTEAACTQLLIQQEQWLPFPWVSAFVALCVSEGSEAVESSWTWKAGGLLFSCAWWIFWNSFPVACSLLKQRFSKVWLRDAGDNMCPEGERVVLRGLKSLHGNLLFLKCLHTKDDENCWCRRAEHLCQASVSQPHSFQVRRAAGESLLCRPPAAFLTSQKGHVKTNVIKRAFKVLFKVCWLFCRGFWSCRILKFDCSSAMTQNFAAGSLQRGHTGNWRLLCGCLAWVCLIPLWFSLQCIAVSLWSVLRFVHGGVCTREPFVRLGEMVVPRKRQWICGNGHGPCAPWSWLWVVLDVMHNLVELENTQKNLWSMSKRHKTSTSRLSWTWKLPQHM